MYGLTGFFLTPLAPLERWVLQRPRCPEITGSLYVDLRVCVVFVRALTDAGGVQMSAAMSINALACSVLPVRATRAARTNKVQLRSCKSVLGPYPAPNPSDDARWRGRLLSDTCMHGSRRAAPSCDGRCR